jgi:uncharacterized surface protein with fasciclin (FAS1) repeats
MKIRFFLLLLTGVLGMLAGCKRTLDAPIPAASGIVWDSSGSIRTKLASPACSCSLFNQALIKAGMDSPFLYYTVMVPSDSAMMAAGLTPAVINSLSPDSLQKIVGYHLVLGLYGDSSVLDNDTLTALLPSLRRDPSSVPEGAGQAGFAPVYYQQNLYIWNRGALYINGIASGAGKPVKASNGWIYPVNRVLFAPSRSVWDLLQSRPELSLYVAAIRLTDSINTYNYVYGQVYDSALFSNVYVHGVPNYPYPVLTNVTVLAPTNDAFAQAGFHTVDDLRSLALRSLPGGGGFDGLDSVLKEHYLFESVSPPLFYQDFLYSPVINNGIYNTNNWYMSLYQSNPSAPPVYPQFSGSNGNVSVQWNPLAAPALLSAGTTPLMATNGVIYEIGQLFYPHN